MARPRATTYGDQQAQIMAAAAALFARRGYTATTMNEVAAASGVSKATLYHYFKDKSGLLEQIALGHIRRLQALVLNVPQTPQTPQTEQRLRLLIEGFMAAYAGAQHQHRVLTEDVRFLPDAARRAVIDGQRDVVAAFADAVAQARPDLGGDLHKPLAMLLFGMINWTFTWLRPQGRLKHADLAPIVCDLFLGGLAALNAAGAGNKKMGRPARPPRVASTLI